MASEESTGNELKNYDEIRQDFDDRNSKLEKRITNIEYQQQALQNFIANIEQTINFLENEVNKENNKQQPNVDRIQKLRNALTKNIEILNSLHNTYKEYESVKFRYYKELDDNSIQKHKLVEIELRKLDEKTDNFKADDFIQMMQMLARGQKIDGIGNTSQLSEDETENLISEAGKDLNSTEYEL